MRFSKDFVTGPDFVNLFGIPIDRGELGTAIDDAVREAKTATQDFTAQARKWHKATGEVDPLAELLPGAGSYCDTLLDRFADHENYAFDSVSLLPDPSTEPTDDSLPGAIGKLVSRVDDVEIPARLGAFRGFFKGMGLFALKRHFNKNEQRLLDAQYSLAERRWRRRRPEWLKAHDESLSTYFVELFAGRFRDRNGTGLGFDLRVADLARFDELEVSPKVVGQIFYAFVEFASDLILRVPFYSPQILDTYRRLRVTNHSLKHLIEGRDDPQLCDIPRTIPDLKAAIEGHQSWGTIGGSNAYDHDGARRLLERLSQADGQAIKLENDECDLCRELDLIETVDPNDPQYPSESSDVQTAFTCFKGNVIKEHLHCIFLNDDADCDPTGGGCLESNLRRHAGGHAGGLPDTSPHVDYADLVGAVVSFASRSVEKSTRSLVGGLIRGGGPASLGNEVLAEIVTASAACLAKKAVEKLSYVLAKRVITDATIIDDEEKKRAFLEALRRLHLGGHLTVLR